MNSWREFVQRWVLKSSVKQGKKASSSPALADAKGILLIFPRETTAATPLFAPVKEWLAERDESNILAVIPSGVEDQARILHSSIKTIIITDEDITRTDLPTRDLRRHLAQSPTAVTVLLADEYDSFIEVLYAIVPSRFKSALFHPQRDSYTDLLLQPKKTNDPAKKMAFMLDALATFAGNRVPAPKQQDANRRAAERFAHRDDSALDDAVQVPKGSPA